MILPSNLNYPIIAIADLHGQSEQLKQLVARLERVAEWDDCALVFLGDYVDRGEDVPGTIDMVLELLSRRPGGSAVLGNHDLALVRAARLDDGPRSPYWIDSYLSPYDHEQTFLGYLGQRPNQDEKEWEHTCRSAELSCPNIARRLVALGGRTARSLVSALRAVPEFAGSATNSLRASHRRESGSFAIVFTRASSTDREWQPEYPYGSEPTKTCPRRLWRFQVRSRSPVTSGSRRM